jgi:hypothetical protein
MPALTQSMTLLPEKKQVNTMNKAVATTAYFEKELWSLFQKGLRRLAPSFLSFAKAGIVNSPLN